MENKKCNKCLEVKPVSEFGKESRAKNGYKPRCKKCSNEDLYLWREKNPDYMSLAMKKYYLNNTEKVKASRSKYYSNNIEKKKAYNKRYRQKNLEKMKENDRLGYIRNAEDKKKKAKEYREKNKEVILSKKTAYVKARIKRDPVYRLRKNIACLLRSCMRNKRDSTFSVLGYTLAELINSLGKAPGRGEQVDHKIPISWFTPETPVDIIFDLRNLQILSRLENQSKNNRFSDEVPLCYYIQIKNSIKSQYIHKIKYYGKDPLQKAEG